MISAMKKLFVLSVIVGVLGGTLLAQSAGQKPAAPRAKPAQPAAKGMTNADVVQMVQAGLSDALVIQAIQQAAKRSFDTSPAGLVALKTAKVSDAIIQVMMNPGGAATAAPAMKAVETSAPPAAPAAAKAAARSLPDRDAGIYVETNGQVTQLEPTVYAGGKTGGTFASAMTGGIAKSSWKGVVRGSKASQRISDGSPTFYFYFEQKGAGLSYAAVWGAASSPNEFVLARLTPKGSEREVVMMEMNAFGARSGTRGKDVVDFKVEKIQNGVYKVNPLESMAPGEYCFYYAATTAAAGGKLFDFGVDAAK